jgi:predicted KAP-like P-loop ATPase
MAITSVSPVYAKNLVEDRKEIRLETKAAIEARQELKKDIREEIKEKVASRVGEIKKFFGVRMALGQASITAINSTVLTVQKDGKTYTVNTGTFDKCTTQYRRRFWGKGSLSEMSVGDMVNVFGIWSDEAKTAVNACLIRDTSIQKRFGVFFGEVKSILSTGFVMSTVSEKRADQTVTVSSSTKFINRKEGTITQADIKVGDKVRRNC